jgi:putrescine importer
LNFGGLFGFMCVNLSVIVYYYFKQKQKKVLQYFLLHALGFVICFYLWIHLSTIALTVGGSWLAIGIIYAAIETKGFKKKPPVLSE